MDSLLKRNIAEILPSAKAFESRMAKSPIKIYLGIDPSSPYIHIGHAVALWKLRELQDAGHKVILLIGDFTGMIGDPTDRSAARKKLTREEVLENAKTYKEQARKIIRLEGKNAAEVKFNSEWLDKLSSSDIIELSSFLTVQQMQERDFFRDRLKAQKPIHLHEFLYPLMQGYDSVAMEVDAEIGGTDQTFNMLVGRALLKVIKNKEKFVLSVPLLEGLDGRKMSKSFNNYIGVTDNPENMFGKVMSLRDNLIVKYFEMATRLPDKKIQSIKAGLEDNSLHPMKAKKKLAWEIVNLYHGKNGADIAKKEFERVFQKGEKPAQAQTHKVTGNQFNIVDALVDSQIVKSKNEARRLIEQGGIEKDGTKIKDPTVILDVPAIIKVGKHRFLNVAKA